MKNLKNKQLKSILTLFIVISLTTCIVAFAAYDFGEFSEWNSNTSQISYWSDSDIKIWRYKYSGFAMDISDFNNCSDTAAGDWSSELNCSYSFDGSSSSWDVKLLGLSRSQAQNAGVPDDAYGIGSVNNRTLIGYGYYNGSRKSVYENIGSGLLYVVWDDVSAEWPIDEWQAIFAHEYGHILGYLGHDDVNDSVMATNAFDIFSNGIVGPQQCDFDHMNNMY